MKLTRHILSEYLFNLRVGMIFLRKTYRQKPQKMTHLTTQKFKCFCMVKSIRNKFKRKINNHKNHLTHDRLLSLINKPFSTSRLVS